MKKILFSLAALSAFGLAQAQEEAGGKGFSKNDVFISGSMGLSSDKTGDNKNTYFNVTPRVGYFVSENIAIGAQLGYNSSKTEAGSFESKRTGFSGGLFGRYYVKPANDFSLFAQLSATYSTTKTEDDNQGDDVTRNGFGLGLAPGISYFVSEHFALEATFGFLNYGTSKPDVDGADSTDTFSIGLDTSAIQLGLIYKF